MNPDQPIEDLAHVRLVLDRQTRFLSLSGLAGVSSGLVALASAAIAYAYLRHQGLLGNRGYVAPLIPLADYWPHVQFLTALSLLTLVAALGMSWFFTLRLARRRGEPRVWNRTSRRMLTELVIPLATGGLACSAMLSHGLYALTAPCTLVFYGLGLAAAAKYTVPELKLLGLTEVALGLVGLFVPGLGLLLWATGFGLLHILYGLFIYRKYEA